MLCGDVVLLVLLNCSIARFAIYDLLSLRIASALRSMHARQLQDLQELNEISMLLERGLQGT